jgi:hypothetical protein
MLPINSHDVTQLGSGLVAVTTPVPRPAATGGPE